MFLSFVCNLTCNLCLTESEHPVHSSGVLEAVAWPKCEYPVGLTEADEDEAAIIRPGCNELGAAAAAANIGGAIVADIVMLEIDDDMLDKPKGCGDVAAIIDSFLAKYLRMQSWTS